MWDKEVSGYFSFLHFFHHWLLLCPEGCWGKELSRCSTNGVDAKSQVQSKQQTCLFSWGEHHIPSSQFPSCILIYWLCIVNPHWLGMIRTFECQLLGAQANTGLAHLSALYVYLIFFLWLFNLLFILLFSFQSNCLNLVVMEVRWLWRILLLLCS